MNWRFRIALTLTILIALVISYVGWHWLLDRSNSNRAIRVFLSNPEANLHLETNALTQCNDAPFILPSDGFIGLLWRDDAAPYTPINRHTGIDIFGSGQEGTVPVYAVYDGWLTRLEDWHSTVIIRHQDPLREGRTIWTYYTHMAARNGNQSFIVDDFPRGTFNLPIEQGTLIGFQGAYSPQVPVAMHLHLSIVTSESDGSFRNEAILENTLDPSPYFGMNMNADGNHTRPLECEN